MTKKRLIIGAAILIVLALAVYLVFIRKPKEPGIAEGMRIDPGFSEYVYAYTYGMISSKSTVKIILNKPSEKFDEDDAIINAKLFKFKPNIKGETKWIDPRTIEFVPDAPLPSGQLFEASFNLQKVLQVEDQFAIMNFGFQVVKQALSIKHEGVLTYDDNFDMYSLKGKLLFADVINKTEVLEYVKAVQEKKKYNINLIKINETHYKFAIDSIRRLEEGSYLKIRWDGSEVDEDFVGEEEIEIPALDEYKVLETKVYQQPDQYVKVVFSDNISENQYFNYYVSLGNDKELKYSVDNNILKVYPYYSKEGKVKLTISKGIKNTEGKVLDSKYKETLSFDDIKPAVELIGDGAIMPSSEGLILQFKAVNLSAVDVSIIKIYENNIPQFLQVNQLDGMRELKRVGRPVFKQRFDLSRFGNNLNYREWNNYAVDLSKFIANDPGALYRVTISFKKRYSLYACEEGGDEESNELVDDSWDQLEEDETSNWDYYEDNYYYYNYYERDNPCHKAYYTKSKFPSKNILASNLGIIAKSDNNHHVTVIINDLRTTEPLGGITVELFNYQQQIMSTAVTDKDGIARLESRHKPYLLVATDGEQKGYLRLDDGSSLSLSRFDVSGQVVQKGIKGFIYGERGVWRPGDSLFLTFVLEDRKMKIPDHHPVRFELTNPEGQVIDRAIRTSNVNGFYTYNTATSADAITGNYNLSVMLGGAKFNKTLKIESVKPNRLKIQLDFGKEQLNVLDPTVEGKLHVKWLHGATAKNLKARTTVILNSISTRFKKYGDYVFDDPVRDFATEENTIFDGRINSEGKATISSRLWVQDAAPGMLKADFITRVFEESGDFSVDKFSIPYAPYEAFIGIKVPKGDKARGMLLTDTVHKAEVVTVDVNGKPISVSGIRAKLYKIKWSWWWESTNDNLASYIGTSSYQPIIEKTISTKNGKGQFKFEVKYPDWGRYLIRLEKPGGHATGKIIYMDWPGWAGRAQRENPGGASMLTVNTDKQEYKVDEKIKIGIPATHELGRVLVSVESGSRVLDMYWVDTQKEYSYFEIEAIPEMAPTAYISVTLVQPHVRENNDTPIRMYGYTPVKVVDPNTVLTPVINMPDKLSPEKTFTLKVSEKNAKPMTYTVAVVDEGLLDLTRFQTPDPWNSFYAREALGIKTWDVYDMVMGAYGAELERIFAIGGGGFDEERASESETNRFKPMVKVLGPFRLDAKKTNQHKIKMPNYIGSVRTMVVAGYNGAYGSAEKATPVQNPIMVLGTLPRVLSPGEEVDLPVNLFVMDENIRSVDLTLEKNDLFEGAKTQKKTIKINETGEKLEIFKLKVGEKAGKGKVKLIAKGAGKEASYEIDIEVSNPNPYVTEVENKYLEPGQAMNGVFELVGSMGTNTFDMEISEIPPIDLSKRLKYLVRYPHGCLEQTTSSVFPQLYLDKIMKLDKGMRIRIDGNIKAGIDKLKRFQISSGAFVYWPGGNTPSNWSTSYVGHFLLEADKQGYDLPPGFKSKWIQYQKQAARNWMPNADHYNNSLDQAYRLYTLALAGKPMINEMNKLREDKNLNKQARARLAGAYSLAGQKDAAKELIQGFDYSIKPYTELGYTFGSNVRDKAMILETLIELDEMEKAFPLLKEIADRLSSDRWLNTQATAYALIGVSKYAMNNKGKGLEVDYAVNGQKDKAKSDLSLFKEEFNVDQSSKVDYTIKNTGEKGVYVRLINIGQPLMTKIEKKQSGIDMKMTFMDMDGKPIDPKNLKQGTDFKVDVTIKNPLNGTDYKNMALTFAVPSGWEIRNDRLHEVQSVHTGDIPDYIDIRDDRLMAYFDIKGGVAQTYTFIFNAAYVGEYIMPITSIEAMYDHNIHAREGGGKAKVVK